MCFCCVSVLCDINVSRVFGSFVLLHNFLFTSQEPLTSHAVVCKVTVYKLSYNRYNYVRAAVLVSCN